MSVPPRRKVRMDPLLNDWAADQAPANHSHRAWRSGVIMRICDAGKHASAGSSPAICGVDCRALARIKSLHKNNFCNILFNCFTNQGHGTGYYLEDTGIKDVITASNKNACCHL